jgi:GT2 family glycosyltransferase
VNLAENDSNIGFIGSNVYFYDEKNKIQSTGATIHWCKDTIININEYKGNCVRQVDSIMGCALLT